ncbi:MAG: hypothetical protein HY819_19710 [Acidobacteria bacterium]|nr:hypothetical protein [Acidobacteriota bacterium]
MSLLANRTELLLKSVFQVSKSGNNTNEYNNVYDYSLEEQRFAIADGIGESFYSRLWAKTLVTGLVATAPFQFLESEQDLVEWLEPMQMTWKKIVEWEQSPQIASHQLESGTFSTLLGLQLLDPEPVSPLPGTKPADEQMRWQAIAIGNSCLFQIRRDHLNYAFPLNSSNQFNSNSSSISSVASKNQQIWRQFHHCQEICYETDTFFLMTESLAQWFLLEYEQERKPWAELYYLQDQEDFQDFITNLRNSGKIRNTDVTLLTFQLGKEDVSIAPANYSGVETVDSSLLTTPLSVDPQDNQLGTTFLVKEQSKTNSRESKTDKHKTEKQPTIKPPQFGSLDQPSVLKQIGKSIIGLLGKKEDEE